MRSPRILGESRADLKFVNDAMQNCLSTPGLHTIVLDNKNDANKVNEEDNSSEYIANEEVVDSDISIIKDNLKCKVINVTKIKNTMMEGSVPDFNDKPFFQIFNMPSGNESTVGNLLN